MQSNDSVATGNGPNQEDDDEDDPGRSRLAQAPPEKGFPIKRGHETQAAQHSHQHRAQMPPITEGSSDHDVSPLQLSRYIW